MIFQTIHTYDSICSIGDDANFSIFGYILVENYIFGNNYSLEEVNARIKDYSLDMDSFYVQYTNYMQEVLSLEKEDDFYKTSLKKAKLALNKLYSCYEATEKYIDCLYKIAENPTSKTLYEKSQGYLDNVLSLNYSSRNIAFEEYMNYTSKMLEQIGGEFISKDEFLPPPKDVQASVDEINAQLTARTGRPNSKTTNKGGTSSNNNGNSTDNPSSDDKQALTDALNYEYDALISSLERDANRAYDNALAEYSANTGGIGSSYAKSMAEQARAPYTAKINRLKSELAQKIAAL